LVVLRNRKINIMEIKKINKNPRMSEIVIHGNSIYLCGQVCEDTSKDIKEQTVSILEKIDELLVSVGSDKSKLLMVQIFIKDMSLYNEMNEVWDAWVDVENPPARACVQAALARPEWLLEIIATASK
jgi:enamine deaminase RidA (YjgF/YER057c/UK114 family)